MFYKHYGAETAQYGLGIIFNAQFRNQSVVDIYLNDMNTFVIRTFGSVHFCVRSSSVVIPRAWSTLSLCDNMQPAGLSVGKTSNKEGFNLYTCLAICAHFGEHFLTENCGVIMRWMDVVCSNRTIFFCCLTRGKQFQETLELLASFKRGFCGGVKIKLGRLQVCKRKCLVFTY